MAAQSLVRASIADPIGTFMTNVMGTAYLLEALRAPAEPLRHSGRHLGQGLCEFMTRDARSLKAIALAVRIHTQLLRRPLSSSSPSYSPDNFYDKAGVHLASARAGNVIGGGDFSRGPAGRRHRSGGQGGPRQGIHTTPRSHAALAARARLFDGHTSLTLRRSATRAERSLRRWTQGPKPEEPEPCTLGELATLWRWRSPGHETLAPRSRSRVDRSQVLGHRCNPCPPHVRDRKTNSRAEAGHKAQRRMVCTPKPRGRTL